ncbi:MAG: hypothetical protein FJ276_00865 [Planctomycetes bacterium]|nr:hypothetical protein [Planctomycetota bacterium]
MRSPACLLKRRLTRRVGLFVALTLTLAALARPLAAASPSDTSNALFAIPNFHDACMGWLVSYANERNYGLYSYLAHLDRVAADPDHRFAMSEIPHRITRNGAPDRSTWLPGR